MPFKCIYVLYYQKRGTAYWEIKMVADPVEDIVVGDFYEGCNFVYQNNIWDKHDAKCTKLFGLGETVLVSNFDNGIGQLLGNGRCLLRLSNDSFNWVVQLENCATFLRSKGLCFGTGRIK